MKLLGLDFETTGVDSNHDRIIEIGAVIWDTERKAPVHILNELIAYPEKDNVKLSPEIQKITGILPEDLTNFGIPIREAMIKLLASMEKADYVVAHNGNEFDKFFFEAELMRLEMVIPNFAWIDTMTDVPYSEELATRKLSYLATEHQFLNPFAHRALFDVLTMFKVLSEYDINEVIELSKSPMVHIRAAVSYDEREKAKNRGYRWNPSEKIWAKPIKEMFLQKEIAEADFQVVQM